MILCLRLLYLLLLHLLWLLMIERRERLGIIRVLIHCIETLLCLSWGLRLRSCHLLGLCPDLKLLWTLLLCLLDLECLLLLLLLKLLLGLLLELLQLLLLLLHHPQVKWMCRRRCLDSWLWKSYHCCCVGVDSTIGRTSSKKLLHHAIICHHHRHGVVGSIDSSEVFVAVVVVVVAAVGMVGNYVGSIACPMVDTVAPVVFNIAITVVAIVGRRRRRRRQRHRPFRCRRWGCGRSGRRTRVCAVISTTGRGIDSQILISRGSSIVVGMRRRRRREHRSLHLILLLVLLRLLLLRTEHSLLQLLVRLRVQKGVLVLKPLLLLLLLHYNLLLLLRLLLT
mmetsp:Transcript_4785/g.10744  ORF Transcript_4785/g.10744 Transcript_4785/m.10744 type:complete len:337 (-) Transcript_4785:269-1279(-)